MRKLPTMATLLCLLGVGISAQVVAQTSSDSSVANTSESSHSWLPYTSAGYVGASVGRTDYGSATCSGLFACDDNATGFKLYTGGRFTPYFAMELGYFNLASASRNGGDIRAQGANLSLVGNLPLGNRFNVLGKLGGAYAWTNTSSLAVGSPSGKEDGFGLSYGAGAQYEISKTLGVRADWDRYRLKYAGGRDEADMYSVGLVFKF